MSRFSLADKGRDFGRALACASLAGVSGDPSLSVIIPALDAAEALARTLPALAEGRRSGLIRELLVVDGGSRDATRAVAEAQGARVVASARGRGIQLAAGGVAAQGAWLLFLHADTELSAGWSDHIADFMQAPGNRERAGYCRFRLADAAPAARRIEAAVAWRCRHLGLPYGDQGLLISTGLYRAIGGFRPMPLMEDVDLVRRLGRRRLALLPVDALTSPARYHRGGYLLRPLRNVSCLGLYFLGVPPALLQRLYG
jgi:rSAM/selenodomain-associated transferase 2